MKPARVMSGATALALGLAAGAPVQAGGGFPPPYGVWAGPGGIYSEPGAAASPVWTGPLFPRMPIGCYFTRVRANDAWLRAEICDWY